MRKAQTRTGHLRELLDRTAGAIEMPRVHENANARTAGRVYDADRDIEVWHGGPRKEFRHRVKSVAHRESSIAASRSASRIKARDANIGGKCEQARCRAHRRPFPPSRIWLRSSFWCAHERVARTGLRDSDQAKSSSPISGARRDAHNLGRRKADHRQVRERERDRHREFRRQSPDLAPPARPRPLHPRVSTMAPN
jgi:hypothetical protein